tara:strand:- start:1485 stop:1697 length:213 start_codon:yes stop_codon:yes gene_type:complete
MNITSSKLLFTGFLTLVIGVILKKIINRININEKDKKIYYIDELSLFMNGVIIYVLIDYYGLKDWYCLLT